MISHIHTCPLTGTHVHSQGHTSTHRDTCPLTGTHVHSQGHMSTHRDTRPLTGTHIHSQGHVHSHAHMSTHRDTCPLTGTHVHSHAHMSTHRDTCPLTATHVRSHVHMHTCKHMYCPRVRMCVPSGHMYCKCLLTVCTHTPVSMEQPSLHTHNKHSLFYLKLLLCMSVLTSFNAHLSSLPDLLSGVCRRGGQFGCPCCPNVCPLRCPLCFAHYFQLPGTLPAGKGVIPPTHM